MAALRKLVWIEEDRYRGWSCSECARVFNPSGPPTGKSYCEMMRKFEAQRDKEFASHLCADHPRAKAQSMMSSKIGKNFTAPPSSSPTPEQVAAAGQRRRGRDSRAIK
jgi:hypothetical protein